MLANRRKRLNGPLFEEDPTLMVAPSSAVTAINHQPSLAYNALSIVLRHWVLPDRTTPQAMFQGIIQRAEHARDEFLNLPYEVNIHLNQILTMDPSISAAVLKLYSRETREEFLRNTIFEKPFRSMFSSWNIIAVRMTSGGIEIESTAVTMPSPSLSPPPPNNVHSGTTQRVSHFASVDSILHIKELIRVLHDDLWKPSLLLLQYQLSWWFLSLQEKANLIQQTLWEVFVKQQEKYAPGKVSLLIEQLVLNQKSWERTFRQSLEDDLKHWAILCEFVAIKNNRSIINELLKDVEKFDEQSRKPYTCPHGNVDVVRSWVRDTLYQKVQSMFHHLTQTADKLSTLLPSLQKTLSTCLIELQAIVAEHERQKQYEAFLTVPMRYNKHVCNSWRKRLGSDYSMECHSILRHLASQGILTSHHLDMSRVMSSLSMTHVSFSTSSWDFNQWYHRADRTLSLMLLLADDNPDVCSVELQESYASLLLVGKCDNVWESSASPHMPLVARSSNSVGKEHNNCAQQSLRLRKSLVNDPYNGCVYHRFELHYLHQRELCQLLDAGCYVFAEFACFLHDPYAYGDHNEIQFRTGVWKELVASFLGNIIPMKRQSVKLGSGVTHEETVNTIDYLYQPLAMFRFSCKVSSLDVSSWKQLKITVVDALILLHFKWYSFYKYTGAFSLRSRHVGTGQRRGYDILSFKDTKVPCEWLFTAKKCLTDCIEILNDKLEDSQTVRRSQRSNQELTKSKDFHCCEISLFCAQLCIKLFNHYAIKSLKNEERHDKEKEKRHQEGQCPPPLRRADAWVCKIDEAFIYSQVVVKTTNEIDKVKGSRSVKANDLKTLDHQYLFVLYSLLVDALTPPGDTLELGLFESKQNKAKTTNPIVSSSLPSSTVSVAQGSSHAAGEASLHKEQNGEEESKADHIPDHWKETISCQSSRDIYGSMQYTRSRVQSFLKVLESSSNRSTNANTNAFDDLLDAALPWLLLEVKGALFVVEMFALSKIEVDIVGDKQFIAVDLHLLQGRAKMYQGLSKVHGWVDKSALPCYKAVFEVMQELLPCDAYNTNTSENKDGQQHHLIHRLHKVKAKDISPIVQQLRSKSMKASFNEYEESLVNAVNECQTLMVGCAEEQIQGIANEWRDKESPLKGQWLWM